MSESAVDAEHLAGALTPAGTPHGWFTLRRMDPVGDFELVHGWMNDPAVARFWDLAGTARRLQSHLDRQYAGTHSRPYLGLLDGVPMSYWELYWAAEDRLAGYYPAQDGDAGMHLLVGPARLRGGGLGGHLIRAVSSWQLAHPRAVRVVAEPDVTNDASLRAFARAGFERAGQVDLPEKTAALMTRSLPPSGASR